MNTHSGYLEEQGQVQDEAIEPATAIRAMTIDSAYMMDLEKQVGSIEVGKHADMIILDKNLFDITPAEINTTKVLTIVFDGKVVFDASKNPTTEKSIEERYDVELGLSGEAGYPGRYVQLAISLDEA